MRRSGGSGLLDSTIALYAPFTDSQLDRSGVLLLILRFGRARRPPISSSSTTGGKRSGRSSTWVGMLWYSIAPAAAGSLVAFVALWVAHARGLHFAGIPPRDFRLYSRLVPVGLAVVAIVFASASIDYWTVMRFFGSRGVTLGRRCLEGSGFFARPAVLPVRSALLFGSARVCVCAGDSLRPGFLGDGAGLAVG